MMSHRLHFNLLANFFLLASYWCLAAWAGEAPPPPNLTAVLKTELKGHTGKIWDVAFIGTTGRVATISQDQDCKIWDLASGKVIATIECWDWTPPRGGDKTLKINHTRQITSMRVSSDGRYLAYGRESNFTFNNPKDKVFIQGLGHLDSGQHYLISIMDLSRLPQPTARVTIDAGPAMGLASNTLASGWQKIGLWDISTGKKAGELALANLKVYSDLVVSADMKRLFVWDGTGRHKDKPDRHFTSRTKQGVVKEVGSGRETIIETPPGEGFFSARFSPDGLRIVTANGASDESTPGKAQVWDALSGKLVLSMEGHKQRVNDVACSADGKYVATASSDQTVRLWDAKTGREILSFEAHAEPVHLVEFGRDRTQTFLLTGSNGMTAKVWTITEDKKP